MTVKADEPINICELPDDSLQEIVSHLGVGDWYRLLRTNKRWAPILKRINHKIMMTIFGFIISWEHLDKLSSLQDKLLIACDGEELLLAVRIYLTLSSIPHLHYSGPFIEISFKHFLDHGHKLIISLTEDTHGHILTDFDRIVRLSIGHDRKWNYRYNNLGKIFYVSPSPILKLPYIHSGKQD